MAVSTPFSGSVRVRVCGIVVWNNRVLMVHLNAPTRPEPFWTVPGGGLHFGESLFEAASREILEETGIEASAERLLAVNEFLEPPWHAVEFYMACRFVGGSVQTGHDPEFPKEKQMILNAAWVGLVELQDLTVNPPWLVPFLINGLKTERDGLFFM